MCENNKNIILEKIYKETYKLFVSTFVLKDVIDILEAYVNRGEIKMLGTYYDVPWGDVQFTSWGNIQFAFSADDEIAEELEMVLQQYC